MGLSVITALRELESAVERFLPLTLDGVPTPWGPSKASDEVLKESKTVREALAQARVALASKETSLNVSEGEYVAVINEWWRLFTEAPEEFEQQAASVKEVLDAQREGREPTLGESNLEFFKSLVPKIRESGRVKPWPIARVEVDGVKSQINYLPEPAPSDIKRLTFVGACRTCVSGAWQWDKQEPNPQLEVNGVRAELGVWINSEDVLTFDSRHTLELTTELR